MGDGIFYSEEEVSSERRLEFFLLPTSLLPPTPSFRTLLPVISLSVILQAKSPLSPRMVADEFVDHYHIDLLKFYLSSFQ
jgi:hypothetical protein